MASSHDIADKYNISYRQVDYWYKIGLIPNPVRKGSGHDREITPEQEDAYCIIALLLRAGFSLPEIRHIMPTEAFDKTLSLGKYELQIKLSRLPDATVTELRSNHG